MLAEIGKRRQVPTKPEGTFESLPAPAKYKGQTIVNEDTGEEWKSDGKKWVPVKPAKGRR